MTLYRERLRPAISMYFYIGLVIPASIIVFLPIAPQGGIPGIVIGIVLGILLYSAVIVLFVATAPVIEVTDVNLRVGRAVIPRAFLGAVQGFDGAEATRQRGPALDARAWLCIRGWVKPVIRLTITDPADPVPYWLVSTRHPDTLVQILDPSPDPATPQPITQGEAP